MPLPPELQNLISKTMITRQIAALDKQIDTLVYQLYDLTDDEIRAVENERSPS